MKKTKIPFILLVICLIFLCAGTANAFDSTDFHSLFEPYMNWHNYCYVIDLDNDGVPELLCFDTEGHVQTGINSVDAIVYKIYDDIGVTQVYSGDPQFINKGIDGIKCSAYYSDDYGRIYYASTDSSYFFNAQHKDGWKYHTFLTRHTPTGTEMIFENNREHIFESSYNYYNSFEEFANEQNYFRDLSCYYDMFGLNMRIPVYSFSIFITPYDSLPDIDPWSTWVSPAVSVNGQLIRFDAGKPYYSYDRTMVPMRKFFEYINATVDWDNYNQKVTARLNGNKVEMFLGSKTIYVNGEARYIDVAPIAVEERTYIPLRAITESLDADVYWDNYNKIAKITVY